jgi:3-deoxy-D-manno-octulosonate 8-phosphate phosphatase (KDO 8-P phosphatase)
MEKNYKELLNQITTFIFDFDGVLTNSTILLFENGELVRNMSVRDGFAIKTAVENGYRVAVISGGTSDAVRSTTQYAGRNRCLFTHSRYKMETFHERIVTCIN